MRSNCERHPTQKGAHIIYDADGFAWRATKVGRWYRAVPSHGSAARDHRRVTSATRLSDLADTIGALPRLNLQRDESGLLIWPDQGAR